MQIGINDNGVSVDNKLYTWENIGRINTYLDNNSRAFLTVYDKSGKTVASIYWDSWNDVMTKAESECAAKHIKLTHDVSLAKGENTGDKTVLGIIYVWIAIIVIFGVFVLSIILKSCGQKTYYYKDEYGYTHKAYGMTIMLNE